MAMCDACQMAVFVATLFVARRVHPVSCMGGERHCMMTLTRFAYTALLFFGVATTLCAPGGLGEGTARADDSAPQGPQRIVFEIAGLRNAKGTVRCILFASAEGYPTKRE